MDAGRSSRNIRMLLLTGLVLGLGTGCVKRRYTIRTDPPGALVYVNGEEVGTTPVSRNYTYYAPREIVLLSDGYKTEKIIEPFPAPWWDNSLTDFFTENLLPVTLRDEREFDYRLTPQTNPTPEDVLTRAQALRQQGQVIPPPPVKSFWQWIGLTR
jgi:hypothetical protein